MKLSDFSHQFEASVVVMEQQITAAEVCRQLREGFRAGELRIEAAGRQKELYERE